LDIRLLRAAMQPSILQDMDFIISHRLAAPNRFYPHCKGRPILGQGGGWVVDAGHDW